MPVRSGEIQSLLGRQQNWKSSSALPLVGGSAEAPLEVPVLLRRAQIRPRGRLRAAVGEIWGSLRCEPFPGLLPARSLELCGCFGLVVARLISSRARRNRIGAASPCQPRLCPGLLHCWLEKLPEEHPTNLLSPWAAG